MDVVKSCCAGCEVKRLPDFGSGEEKVRPTSEEMKAVVVVAAVDCCG